MFRSVTVLIPYELRSSENDYFINVISSISVYLIDQSTHHQIAEYKNLHNYTHKNLKSLILSFCLYSSLCN
jgi:hypothetical protein